jgi:formylglycine-generating enzyme required for sulfatase activity
MAVREFRRLIFLLVFAVAFTARTAMCTGVAITNITLGSLSGGSTTVTFDISWSNSWRSTGGGAPAPNNWDAAWVFIKFRKNGGDWTHASLNNTGHTAPSGSTIDVGLRDTGASFNISTNPGMGVFVYRSADGTGSFSKNGVVLSWNYSQDGVTGSDSVEIRLHAIEMVYVNEGAFFAGDGSNNGSSFQQGSSDSDPWYIASEGAISTVNAAGSGTGVGETSLEYYHAGNGGTQDDNTGAEFTIPAAYPKGYNDFYMMKGEISQGQWVAFFNTLTGTQKTARDITGNPGKDRDTVYFRNNVSWEDSGDAMLPDQGGGTTYYHVAMTYLSWADLFAYLDWAGLRPMTELEFEKAGRGPYPAVAGEFPWGSTSITQATSIVDGGLPTEHAQSGANANYSPSTTGVGPMRVGCLAYGVATRIAAGAGYYGAMNLGDNVYERLVTVGNSTGRSFEGRYHGDGALDSSGAPNVSTWPATGSSGHGVRGTGWNEDLLYARLSNRVNSAIGDAPTARSYEMGGRGVRTAP